MPLSFHRSFAVWLLAALVSAAWLSADSIRAEDVIFTIDPSQSNASWSGSSTVYGDFEPTVPGSLSTPVSGHFLVKFDPTTDTPTSIQFVGGHGYYQLDAVYVATPGPYGSGTAAPANIAGRTPGGEETWALRNISWDFSSPSIGTGGASGNGTGGVFTTTTTSPYVLSGGIDYQTSVPYIGSGSVDYRGHASGTWTPASQWTLSESAPGSGQWTLNFSSHFQYGYDFLPDELISFDWGLSAVATAQFGEPNVAQVAPSQSTTGASALGGSSTTGGVSMEINQATDGGVFSVQQVPNATGLPVPAISAGSANPLFVLSNEMLSTDPQIWNVDYTGSLDGGTATLVFNYDPSLLPQGFDESQLGMWHFNTVSGQWEFGGAVDTNNHTITFVTESFSPFQLGVVPEPDTFALAAVGLFGLAWVARRSRKKAASL